MPSKRNKKTAKLHDTPGVIARGVGPMSELYQTVVLCQDCLEAPMPHIHLLVTLKPGDSLLNHRKLVHDLVKDLELSTILRPWRMAACFYADYQHPLYRYYIHNYK